MDHSQLPIAESDLYYVFPTYGREFADMSTWTQAWRRTMPFKHRFWPGFSGGGILAVSLDIPSKQQIKFALIGFSCGHKPVYGLACGNETGQELEKHVSCATPDRPPGFAIRMGLAERVLNPTVKVTAEHAECLRDECYLLVVPKARRKSLKLIDDAPTWFDTFGITVEPPASTIPASLREEMSDWFTDPGRTMFALRMKGGEYNAAWQLAVVYYVAEYWDTHARGLDSLHFVANIEGAPNFRRFWTSNK